MSDVDVDVVVLDLDGGAMLERCLASIARQTLPPNRVIVFDNGSRTPETGLSLPRPRRTPAARKARTGAVAPYSLRFDSGHQTTAAPASAKAAASPGSRATA